MSFEPRVVCDHVIDCARECGEVTVRRSENGVELGAPATFATVTVGRRAVLLRLTLPGGHRVPAIVRLLSGGEDRSRHVIRLRHLADVDDEVRAWLCEAYRGAIDAST